MTIMRVLLSALSGMAVLAMVAGLSVNAAAPPAFDGGNALEHVRQLVSLGPRPPGSAALDQARQYMRAQLAQSGVRVTEQAFDAETPVGRVPMVNVRATIPGTRPERVLIGGHYDTKLFREFRFVGANDGGASTAFLLEMARVLQARKNPFTIELVFFDGEEAFIEWQGTDHTYGSRYYVEAARRAGELGAIKALILVDMIGDRDLNIRRESASTRWLTDAIWGSAKKLGFGSFFLPDETPIEDDHVAFLRAGIPAVDIIDLDYPPWHTAGDTLDKVSARSMEIVGRVVVDALPVIEARLQAGKK
jgi:Zn-dependent M28 family amino/carboxypeptidase